MLVSEGKEATPVVQADSGGSPHCVNTNMGEGEDRWRKAAKRVTVGQLK